jgi:hypothetical protein
MRRKAIPAVRTDSGKRVWGVAVVFFLLWVRPAGIAGIAGQITFYMQVKRQSRRKIKILRKPTRRNGWAWRTLT